jgi:hypothetical protein
LNKITPKQQVKLDRMLKATKTTQATLDDF